MLLLNSYNVYGCGIREGGISFIKVYGLVVIDENS
jgi:hypothetical protein